MATIITKNSQTASAVPAAASLSVGELAVNTADGKLYTEHTGGVVKEIIPSTVVDGGITANKLASNAVTTAKIADANVTGAKLENSGVTAGTYTTATVTVDAKGRVTSASSGSGGGVISLNGQTGAITDTGFNAIGSYSAGTNRPGGNATVTEGTTVAGSSIVQLINSVPSSPFQTYNTNVGESNQSNLGRTGTWRAMGRTRNSGADKGGNYITATNLWVRIS